MSSSAAFCRCRPEATVKIPVKRASLIVLVLCASKGFPETAALAASDKTQRPCYGTGSQMDVNPCKAKQSDSEERKLGKTYRHPFASMDDEHRDLLKRAQSAWISFREASCELEASQALHGSMHDMLMDACRTAMAEARIKELIELEKSLADFRR
jgi:uncharacterized protein YecT (DUF1311 family)